MSCRWGWKYCSEYSQKQTYAGYIARASILGLVKVGLTLLQENFVSRSNNFKPPVVPHALKTVSLSFYFLFILVGAVLVVAAVVMVVVRV